MDKIQVSNEICKILSKISGKELIDIGIEWSLFGIEYNIRPREVVYLILEIEKRYGVKFDEEFLLNYDLFTVEKLSEQICNISNKV